MNLVLNWCYYFLVTASIIRLFHIKHLLYQPIKSVQNGEIVIRLKLLEIIKVILESVTYSIVIIWTLPKSSMNIHTS